MTKLMSLNVFYVELAFWATTAAGILGIVAESLTGLGGVKGELLTGFVVGQAVLSFVAAALLRRAT